MLLLFTHLKHNTFRNLIRLCLDNINVTNKYYTMFKITLDNTWNKNGIHTNYVKYLKVNTIQEVFNFYKLDTILKIEEC